MQKLTAAEFLMTAEKDGLKGRDLSGAIRRSMVQVLGELPAVATLAYAGDASDGDLTGFVTRLNELLGDSAGVILSSIMEEAQRDQRDKRDAPATDAKKD